MNTSNLRKLLAIGLAGILAGAGGCTTGLTTAQVWQIDDYHPACTPKLRLFYSEKRQDVLVRYDESFAGSKMTQSRAYWLNGRPRSGAGDCVQGGKPAFVKFPARTRLTPIPFLRTEEAVPTNSYCALPTNDQRSFKLWWNGVKLGDYHLPVYSAAPPVTFWRVVLTPVTATTDVVIVGGVLFCIGFGASAGSSCDGH